MASAWVVLIIVTLILPDTVPNISLGSAFLCLVLLGLGAAVDSSPPPHDHDKR